jgi:type II secretory pathway predicted ATPase ExeA
MVLRHFNLREQPFGVTPDPRYLFVTPTHGEALSSLLYGLESGLGFLALTAKPGMGKTTLLFEALRRMEPTTKTVFLFQSISTPAELLRALLMDLGIADTEGSLVDLQSRLNQALASQCSRGKRVVVVIDEAQNLDQSVLEAVRMLSNFETARHKLVQIVLSGQPQLAAKLASPQLLQLRQRISIFAHLEPLTTAETTAYIHHRMRVAGCAWGESVFADLALALIAQQSEGIPRNINNICFNALSLGCALHRKVIDVDVVKEVISDLDITRVIDDLDVSGVTSAPDISGAIELPKPSQLAVRESTVRQPANTVALRVPVWSLATAICAILLFFAGRALLNKPVPAKPSLPPDSNITSSAARTSDASKPPVPGPQVRLVQVRKGQTLTGICAETFAGCRPQLLRELSSLNPSLVDPDRIRVGQRIFVPDFSPTSMNANEQGTH